jgi:hypothetical protein
MTEKSINQIIFDPDIMALTLTASVFLFLVLLLDTLVYKTSPMFYWHLFFTITFTLLWFVVVFKYQIDKCVGFNRYLIDLKTGLKSKYSETLLTNFSWVDWVFLVVLLGLLIFCIKSVLDLSNLNIKSFNLLTSGNLTPSEEKFWDLIKSEAAPLTGFYLTLSILTMTLIKEIITEAKNKFVTQKLNEQYEVIIKKLDEIQEQQKRE